MRVFAKGMNAQWPFSFETKGNHESKYPIRKMRKARFNILATAAPSPMALNFFMLKLNAFPTAKRNEGKTRSVGVNPCHFECSSCENVGGPPEVLTMIIKQTVIPRKISRASERFDATAGCSVIRDWLKAEYSENNHLPTNISSNLPL